MFLEDLLDGPHRSDAVLAYIEEGLAVSVLEIHCGVWCGVCWVRRCRVTASRVWCGPVGAPVRCELVGSPARCVKHGTESCRVTGCCASCSSGWCGVPVQLRPCRFTRGRGWEPDRSRQRPLVWLDPNVAHQPPLATVDGRKSVTLPPRSLAAQRPTDRT